MTAKKTIAKKTIAKKTIAEKTIAAPGRTIAEGKTVFLRTPTQSFVGTIRRIDAEQDGMPATVTLQPAAWMADTGRLGEFLKNGTTSEMEAEPYPGPVEVPISSIIDVSPWDHKVPRKAV